MLTEFCRAARHSYCETDGCQCVCHSRNTARDDDAPVISPHHSADN